MTICGDKAPDCEFLNASEYDTCMDRCGRPFEDVCRVELARMAECLNEPQFIESCEWGLSCSEEFIEWQACHAHDHASAD